MRTVLLDHDQRLQIGAYLTDGKRLYEILDVERVTGQPVRVWFADSMSMYTRTETEAFITANFRLVTP